MVYRGGIFENDFHTKKLRVNKIKTNSTVMIICQVVKNRSAAKKTQITFDFVLPFLFVYLALFFSETIGWYESMLKALPPDDYLGDLATRYYEGCLGKVRTVENTQEILSLLTEAIRIAPATCPVLMDCHMVRAEILIKSENYAVGCSSAFEMFDAIFWRKFCSIYFSALLPI